MRYFRRVAEFLDHVVRQRCRWLGLQAFFNDRILFSVDYEMLMGKSDVGGRLGSSDIRTDGTAILGTLGYALYHQGSIRWGLGFGLGHYESDATAEFVVDEDLVESVSFDGSKLGQHYVMFVESPVLGKIHLMVMVGYRAAKLEDLDLVVDIPETPEPAAPVETGLIGKMQRFR